LDNASQHHGRTTSAGLGINASSENTPPAIRTDYDYDIHQGITDSPDKGLDSGRTDSVNATMLSPTSATFLWTNFTATGGDHPSFEAWPTQKDYALHEVMLAGWGMPIGELFDLEKLGKHCKEIGRWSFFLTSEPCNVPGGVASPPNALAIF